MSSQLRIALVMIGFALVSSVDASAARAPQKALTNDQKQIVDTVNTILTAHRTDVFTSSMGALDSMERPSWPSLRRNMLPARIMNGT
jgi:hypothetical protein